MWIPATLVFPRLMPRQLSRPPILSSVGKSIAGPWLPVVCALPMHTDMRRHPNIPSFLLVGAPAFAPALLSPRYTLLGPPVTRDVAISSTRPYFYTQHA